MDVTAGRVEEADEFAGYTATDDDLAARPAEDDAFVVSERDSDDERMRLDECR